MENQKKPYPGMATQEIYQISVKGVLDDHWTDWFNGTVIKIEHNRVDGSHTTLTCRVRDQAELLGILTRLNSLNLPLLGVMRIDVDKVFENPVERV